VEARYFAAFGIPLRAGRAFDGSDRAGSTDVGIVNEALSRSAFPDEDPIGRQMTIGLDGHDRPITIVGVVADTRNRGPTTGPGPVLFRPIGQTDGFSAESAVFVANVASVDERHVFAMREYVRASRPGMPVYGDALGTALAAPFLQTQASLLGVLLVFALAALLLSGVGVYGVASHAMRQRRREIGVRMALGADSVRVLTGVLSGGLLRAALGIPVGVLLAVWVGRSLGALLFEVPPADPLTLGAVSGAVLLVTALALWIPAYQAARTDPALATRAD
jgi:putative ABC transport system permease protein